MLTKRFGVLQTIMETNVIVSEALVKSICLFHNFIKRENNFIFFPSDDVHDATQSYNSNTSLTAKRSTRPTAEGMAVRDTLKEYFVSPRGALEWQDQSIQ